MKGAMFLVDRERMAMLIRADRAKRSRGVWVPPELEADWRNLKRKRFSSQEAAEMLGLSVVKKDK